MLGADIAATTSMTCRRWLRQLHLPCEASGILHQVSDLMWCPPLVFVRWSYTAADDRKYVCPVRSRPRIGSLTSSQVWMAHTRFLYTLRGKVFPLARAAASPAHPIPAGTPRNAPYTATAPPQEQSPPSGKPQVVFFLTRRFQAAPAVRIEFHVAKSCLAKQALSTVDFLGDVALQRRSSRDSSTKLQGDELPL